MLNKILLWFYSFLKVFDKTIVYIWAIFSFLVCVCFILLRIMGLSGPIDGCLDDGGVWDGEFEECRFDCNTWNEKQGCVMISDEEMEDYVNGYCQNDGKGLYRCRMAALELSKRKQWKQMKGF